MKKKPGSSVESEWISGCVRRIVRDMRTPPLPLPGTGIPAPPLFESKALASYLGNRSAPLGHIATTVEGWLKDLVGASSTQNEQNLEQAFNARVISQLLQYVSYPSAPATFWPKPSTEVTNLSGTPDGALGSFSKTSSSFIAVIEIKRPGTNLDKPQSRKDGLTPVQQAFSYARKLYGVRWVIVTDMTKIRLYSVESQYMYESINLKDCIINNGKATTDLLKLRYLLHSDSLLRASEDGESLIESLLAKSASRKREIEAGFYETYYKVRSDLLEGVSAACEAIGIAVSFSEVLQATQRLLDRIVFIDYCEQHPVQLIAKGTLRKVIESARNLPGLSTTRIYTYLKALFREIDEGSGPASGLRLPAYNGELFKPHAILDGIDLPDSLATKVYSVRLRDGNTRVQRGIWGFDAYDLWQELDEHLLGSLFEQSLSDIIEISGKGLLSKTQRSERRRHGIFYTDDILSDFAADAAIETLLPAPNSVSLEEQIDFMRQSANRIRSLRIIDPACGSGAFLVSAYRKLSAESQRLNEAIADFRSTSTSGQLGFDLNASSITEAALLRSTLFGVDLLPQAVEIAKLALWLRSARKAEPVADLGSNLITADSLNFQELSMRLKGQAQDGFDLVIGNPPWGGQIDSSVLPQLRSSFDVPRDAKLDTWEWFILLAISLARPEGYISLILPDTLFSPRKVWIRGVLFSHVKVDRLANLGMRWFTDRVRMGTCILQAQKSVAMPFHTFVGYSLTGAMRTAAIEGRVLLSQIETELGKDISQASVLARTDHAIQLGRGVKDDLIEEKMRGGSLRLDALCLGRRGEEVSNYGLLWRCSGCGNHVVPPDARRQLTSKQCPVCAAALNRADVSEVTIVASSSAPGLVPLVDTEDVHRRHSIAAPSKFIKLGLSGVKYKDEQVFAAPKLLIREAGIGLTAAIDYTNARCVRTLYAYHLRKEYEGLGMTLEYVLAALQSRTMHYYIVLITNQGDPRRPLANLRMETVGGLPIPKISSLDDRKRHDQIVSLMKQRLVRTAPSRDDDMRIELLLRDLWGLSGDDGVFIARELSRLPQFGVLAQMGDLDLTDSSAARLRRRSARGPAFAPSSKTEVVKSELVK